MPQQKSNIGLIMSLIFMGLVNILNIYIILTETQTFPKILAGISFILSQSLRKSFCPQIIYPLCI